MRVVGVDACRAGWVAVVTEGGRFAATHLVESLCQLTPVLAPDIAVTAVDMPLGLLDSGWRQADLRARDCLGGRRSSVFAIPPRAVWNEADYPAANARCRALTGSGMSRQAFALRAKLREANAYREASDGLVYEVHPEVSFRAIAGRPLQHRKITLAGQHERRRLLAAHGLVLPGDLDQPGRAGPDDVLDAAAAAWTAHRIATGEARSLPEPPQRAGDQQIAIWY